MRKLLFISILVTTLSQWITSQVSDVMWFEATEYSLRIKYNNGSWSDWTDWERCRIDVKIDTNNDLIVIYSNETQVYNVIGLMDPPYDPKGRQVKFKVIDQDDDLGYVRLRLTNDGDSQIYIDFSDVGWVYNLRSQ